MTEAKKKTIHVFIEKELHDDIKKYAAKERRSLTAFLANAAVFYIKHLKKMELLELE